MPTLEILAREFAENKDVEANGGTLSVVSAPGHGTCLQVKLPESAAN